MSMLAFALSKKIKQDTINNMIIKYIHEKYPGGKYSYNDLLDDPYLKPYLVKCNKFHKCP